MIDRKIVTTPKYDKLRWQYDEFKRSMLSAIDRLNFLTFLNNANGEEYELFKKYVEIEQRHELPYA